MAPDGQEWRAEVTKRFGSMKVHTQNDFLRFALGEANMKMFVFDFFVFLSS